MNDAGEIQVISAPAGYVFELIYRSRGVPFREGLFQFLVSYGGRTWAVGFHTERPSVDGFWRRIDGADQHEVALCRWRGPR